MRDSMKRPSRSLRGAVFIFSFAFAAAFHETVATAQTKNEPGLAEQLFQDAQQLMAQRRYKEACPKFAESQRLDAGTGTLLNLAACHEAEGKTATAWGEFNAARALSQQGGRMDRVSFANEHIKSLAPRLCRLTIEVPETSKVDGLVIELDGVILESAAWGAPAPIDPGKHQIRVSAPGKEAWQREVYLIGDAARKVVAIPALLTLEETRPLSAPSIPQAHESSRPFESTQNEAPDRGPSRPTPASVYWIGGTTLLLAAGAGVTGALYLSKNDDYERLNRDPSTTDHERNAAEREVKKIGIANAALTGGAVLGLGVTAILYFTRPSRSPHTSLLTPWVTDRAVGLSASGSL
jgi:hypothetical protein